MIKLNAIVVKDSEACFNHFTSVNNTCNYWFTNLYSLEKYSPEYKRETRQKERDSISSSDLDLPTLSKKIRVNIRLLYFYTKKIKALCPDFNFITLLHQIFYPCPQFLL